MSKKRNRLRDSYTIRTVTSNKQPNGDLVETIDSESTYRCTAIHRESVLIDRIYEVPQVEFDYLLEVRSETLLASGIGKASRLTISKSGTTVYQVTEIINDTLRKSKVFVSATDK